MLNDLVEATRRWTEKKSLDDMETASFDATNFVDVVSL